MPSAEAGHRTCGVMFFESGYILKATTHTARSLELFGTYPYMKKEYIRFGKCIWCGKEKLDVNFNERPHTISKKLGSNNIGVDICESCNKYFGIREHSCKYPMSVELAFKEIFNVSRILIPDSSGQIQGSILKSIYFEYYSSKRILRIKNNFKFQKVYSRITTAQGSFGLCNY